jgi:hypothetical protein
MKLYCDGVEFPAKISRYEGAPATAPGDGEIAMFAAASDRPFPRDSTWTLEDDGKRVELAIRGEHPVTARAAGAHSASFTAPAVG